MQLAEKLVRLRREREERLAREGATAHPGVAKLKNVNKQGSGGILRRFLRALSCYSCRHPGISNADVDYATAEEALLRFDRTQRLVAEGKSAQSSSNVMPSAQVPASSAGQSDQLTEELKRSSIVTVRVVDTMRFALLA